MAEIEEKVNQYKAYLAKYFDNPKEEKILYVFKKLDRLNITLEILQSTGVGKAINSFRKHDGQIGEKARQLVSKWKQLVSVPPAFSGSGLQTETVSETTYGSNSGRVMQRLDEVVMKAPYMDGTAMVKKEKGDAPASRVTVKEEPREDADKHKSTSASSSSHREKHGSSSKEKPRKREREETSEGGGDNAERAKKKPKHGGVEEEEEGFDLARVKKEKVKEALRVKKEPEERVALKHETERAHSPAPTTGKGHGDKSSTVTKDRHGRESSSGRHSSSHHKSSSGRHRDDSQHVSRGAEASKDKQAERSGGSSSKASSSDGKITIKKEQQEKESRGGGFSSTSGKVMVKTEPPEKSDSVSATSSGAVKVKLEGEVGSSSSKQSSKAGEKSHSKHSSGGHHRSADGTCSKSGSSSERTSGEKASSSSSKHRDKASSSGSSSKDKERKAVDKKPKAPSSSKSGSSRSKDKGAKVKRPVVQEFNMFDMANGMSDEGSEGEADRDDEEGRSNAACRPNGSKSTPVKVKFEPGKTFSVGRMGKDKAAGGVRIQAKLPTGTVPLPRVPMSLTQEDIIGSLPETTPIYKPLPHVDLNSPSKKLDQLESYEEFGSKKNCRTVVYSGRRNIFLTSVPTLYDSCLTVLKDNIDALDFVGGVPYDILKPVLVICTPTQLYNIEDANPQFIGETDELWKEHCKKDFRTQKPEQFESWREMYIRCHDARDAKLKSLTASISKSIQKAKEPVRTTKLAYVDTAVKAPRDVARQQRINGTAGPMGKRDPYMKLTSHKVPGKPVVRQPIPRSIDSNKSTSLGRTHSDKHVKMVAPMMRKTLKFMKSLKRK